METLTRIAELFENASKKLKRPRIILSVPDIGDIELKLRDETIWVNHHKEYGIWYGRITRDGRYFPGRTVKPHLKVEQAIQRFNADPVSVAKEFGDATGHCCFCDRELSDNRSLTVGYGPICAGRYGLPWGED